MDIAALVLWLLTAVGGFVLLGVWVANGGVRDRGASHLPPPVLFGHFLLAAAGLVLWIVYVAGDSKPVAWTAFGFLVPVALLGLTMFARWIPVYRERSAAVDPVNTALPAERNFPVSVVLGHGLLAVTTLVLVLIAAIQA
ncbi:MAG: hypothetical protein HOV87_11345 [Catenulispora sp.]|nr:hypothetical protein [Catenulispora sp.]